MPWLEILDLVTGERRHLRVAALDELARVGELRIDGAELTVLLDERLQLERKTPWRAPDTSRRRTGRPGRPAGS